MQETLVGVKTWRRLPDSTILVPQDASMIHVSSFPVSKAVTSWWKDIPRPVQMRVEPYLCDVVLTKRIPIWNNTGCQLAAYMNPSAPRCQTKYLKWICDSARMPITETRPNRFVLPESDHSKTEMPPQPWLLTARDAFVSMCGHIVTQGGLVHTTANCMATGYRNQALLFQKRCPISLATRFEARGGGNITCEQGAPFSDNIVYHKRVFVVGEVDDTYVYHIHLEIMPRLIYHLDFLIANPDIKIMVGCDSKKGAERTLAGLRHGLLSMQPLMDIVGLDMERLVVHQHVYANEVYLPMEGGCQDPVYNTWQILHMRNKFMQMLQINEAEKVGDGDGSKPIMMLMKRSSDAKHTRNGHDSVRQWSDAFTNQIAQQLQDEFPMFQVTIFSDRNETMMRCHACQIQVFNKVRVLIGVHGAGLANMLYMKSNSAVIEFGPYGNDGRCLLGGGPFSRIASVLSHNYMIHHPPFEEFKWIKEGATSEFNVTRFVVHIDSFLKSIGFVQ